MKTGQVQLVFGQATKPVPFVSAYRVCRCGRFVHKDVTCLLCAPLHQTQEGVR